MRTFLGVTRHEFNMSVRRPGFWIAYLLIVGFYAVTFVNPSGDRSESVIAPEQIWPQAGQIVFMFNIFLPLLAGILAADRMQRDFRIGVRELQQGAPLSDTVYILSKYLGVLASVLAPVFLLVLLVGVLVVGLGLAPVAFLGPLLLAFLSISVPAHAFVVAFSLACPLVMPVRIYQVLFTGYWFWGNLLSPQAFPSISDTVLNVVGHYPLQAYFGHFFSEVEAAAGGFTRGQAILNHLVLLACIVAVLSVVHAGLRRAARNA